MRHIGRMLVAVAGLVALTAAADQAAGAGPGYRIYVSNEYGADITVIDGATRQQIGTIPISGRSGEVRPRGMAVAPDGKTVYVAVSDFAPHLETQEDKIVAIDVATSKIVAEYRVGSDPERLAVSPDGRQLWASNEDRAQVSGFDLKTGKLLGSFPAGVEPEGVAVSPDGKFVYVTGEASHTLAIIDAQQLKINKYLLVGNRPRVVIFSQDGTRAYVSAEIGGTVSVIDTQAQRVIHTVSLGLDSRPVEMVLSLDDKRLFVAGGGTSAVYVVDTETYKVIKVIRERMGRRPWGIALALDGKVYTANGLSDSVSVIDAAGLNVIGQLGAGRGSHSVVVGTIASGK